MRTGQPRQIRFATFFEMVWFGHHKGEDERLMALRSEFDNYFGEAGRYKRQHVTVDASTGASEELRGHGTAGLAAGVRARTAS